MAQIDELAEAALNGDALRLRSLTQDLLAQATVITCAPPESKDPTLRAVAAGLIELFAERLGQNPPPWTKSIDGAVHPIYLVRAAKTMRRLRILCDTESPAPLRRRNLFAPPAYLEFA
jgi:hypothetical protein